MASRLLAFVTAAILFSFFAATSYGTKAAYADDTWWVGKGAKADSFVNYKIIYRDLNNARPFIMSIYFQKQDSSGNWIAPAYVQDNGVVIQGNLTLGSNLSILRTGTSSTPPEMDPYLSAYANTLQWLNAFSPQSQPKSLSAPDWGKLACIGCGDLIPSGKETISEPPGSYDATVLVNHYGQTDSKIWVDPNMPYPVKSIFFASVTTGTAPVQYQYDLIDTGTGAPVVPVSSQIIPTPPVTQSTASNNYKVTLDWEPPHIVPNSNESFGVRFADQNGPLPAVSYQVAIKDSNGTTIEQLSNQNTNGGVGLFSAKFDKAGPITLTVTLTSVQGVTMGEFIESTDYQLVVEPSLPEFPVGLAVVISAVIGLAIVLTRTNLMGELFGRRNGQL